VSSELIGQRYVIAEGKSQIGRECSLGLLLSILIPVLILVELEQEQDREQEE
jgi:hypothetical protein